MFGRCKDKEECKKLFKRLAKYLHPDTGGENDLFIMLQDSYEFVVQAFEDLENSKKTHRKEPKYQDLKYTKVFENISSGDDRLEILEDIFSYQKAHPKFHSDFVNSVSDYLEENGLLTSGQYNTLVKIYYSFRMDKKENDRP